MNTNSSIGHYLVAGTAFFVSVCSLFIYIYQSKIMAEQQQVAAWPYVEWHTNNVEGYKLTVQNKGIGPAIVRQVSIKLNGKSVEGNKALVKEVMGAENEVFWINGGLANRVMSAGESVTILSIPNPAHAREFEDRLSRRGFELMITYCSIYGRCWSSSGFTVKRVADDSNTLY